MYVALNQQAGMSHWCREYLVTGGRLLAAAVRDSRKELDMFGILDRTRPV